MRTPHPHLRHGDLGEKCKTQLYQIDDGILRTARHKEIRLDTYPEGVFELAEKLDDVLYIILSL